MARTKVRGKGQITIPRAIRERAHLEEGDPVEVEMVPEGILLKPQKVIDASQSWFWTPEWQAGERQASAEIAAGHGQRPLGGEEFLVELKKRQKQ